VANATKRIYLTNDSFNRLKIISENENITLSKAATKTIKNYEQKFFTEYLLFCSRKNSALKELNKKDKKIFKSLEAMKGNIKWYIKEGEIWAQIEGQDPYKGGGNVDDPEILKVIGNVATDYGVNWKKDSGCLYVNMFTAIIILVTHPGNFGIKMTNLCEVIKNHVLGTIPALEGEFAKKNALNLLQKSVFYPQAFDEVKVLAEECLQKIKNRIDVQKLEEAPNKLFLEIVNPNYYKDKEKVKNIVSDSFWNDISACLKGRLYANEAIHYAFCRHTPYF